MRKYQVVLSSQPYDRWREIAAEEAENLQALHEVMVIHSQEMGYPRGIAGKMISTILRMVSPNSFAELEGISDESGIPVEDLAVMNMMYELSHAPTVRDILGCTVNMRYVPNLGQVHLRTVDWPLEVMKPASRVFEFVGGSHRFLSYGFLGFTGVLTGMVPGEYSVALNWVPPLKIPRYGIHPSPPDELRRVLTAFNNYEDAVKELTTVKLCTGAIFSICGRKRGQACVIEHTGSGGRLVGGKLVAANHYEGSEIISESYTDSRFREEAIKKVRGNTLVGLHRSLANSEVIQEITQQVIVMCPKTGTYSC